MRIRLNNAIINEGVDTISVDDLNNTYGIDLGKFTDGSDPVIVTNDDESVAVYAGSDEDSNIVCVDVDDASYFTTDDITPDDAKALVNEFASIIDDKDAIIKKCNEKNMESA
jgi:hypothetical protein